MFTDERWHELEVYYEDFKQRIYDAGYKPRPFPIAGGADIDKLPRYAIDLLEICEKKFGWEALLSSLIKHRWEFTFECFYYYHLYDEEFRERLLPIIQESKDCEVMRERAGDLLHKIAKERDYIFPEY